MTGFRAALQFGRLLALLLACSQALGAEPAVDADSIKYRRYFVPYDRVKDWPIGDISYVPIEKEEFEQLVASLQSPQQAAISSAARVEQAVYEARLESPELLSGQAKLDIVHTSEAPVLLPLDPWGLAIDRVRWDDADSPEAIFGLASEGRPAAYVDRSAKLLVDWSLRGLRDAAGAVGFALELPRSPLASLILEAPPEAIPEVSAGVLTAEGAGRWRLELGGQNRCLLKFSFGAAAQRARPLALLQQQTRYAFSPGGLEVTADLSLDVHNEPLERLELLVDGELQLMSARFGESDVPWTWSAAGGSPPKRRVTVEFPQPLLGPQQQLQLKALAPLAADQLWTLPTLQPQGVFWQEGSMLLLVPSPLAIDRLLPLGCRESQTSALPEPLSGERTELQAFSPSAAIQVLVSRRLPPVLLDSAVQVEITPDRLKGTWVGEFRVDRGERLSLSAEIQQGWVIDSVASLPDGDVISNDLAPLDLEGRVLTVHLARALSPEHPIRLKVSAHAVVAAQQRPVRAAELQMLSVQDIPAQSRLLAVKAQRPYQLRIEGGEDQPRLEPDGLTARQRRWFAEPPAGTIFDVARSQGSWTAQLEEQPPRFDADLEVEATLTQAGLAESYVIDCSPKSAPIERCLVHFSQSRSEPLRWSLDGTTAEGLTAHRCTPEQELAAGLPDGETWEIEFARPQIGAFAFRATRSAVVDRQAPLSLVALPAAGNQQGRIKVRVTDASPWLIDNHRLKTLPLGAVEESEYPIVRGEYRYDPAGELIANAGPAVSVARSSAPAPQPGAFIWNLRLDSRYQAGGRGVHLATCRLESSGRPRCSLRLPAGAEVLGVWIDDQSIRWGALDGQLALPLPRGRRFPIVEVQFSTSGPPLGGWQSVEAPWPETDLTVLARHWRLWTPPEFELLSLDTLATGAAPMSWSQRLFGVLGRPASEAPFQPGWAGNERAPGGGAGRALDPIAEPPVRGQNDAKSPPAAVWPAHLRAGSRNSDNLYWRVYQFAPPDGAPLEVRFVNRNMILALGWTMMLLTFAFARWLLRGRLATLAGASGLVACTALLAPEAIAPAISGALLALAAGLLAELLTPRLAAEPSSAKSSSSAAGRMAEALALALALGAACGVNQAAAQEPETADKRSKSEAIYRVFIPSDADGAPVGGRYWIPQSMRSELRRRAMFATGEPHGWLIADAAYSVLLGENELDSRLSVVDFMVRYQLQVLSANARVRIPLARDRASLAADSASLDGQPIEPYWEEGGQALLCDVPEPGDYLLEFKLRPLVTSSVDHNSIELLIPPVPSASLEVHLPPDIGVVEVPGAVGPLAWTESRASLKANLGPAPRLTIRWPQTMGGPEPTIDVDELLWLKVRPGSVAVDGRIRYHVSGGPVRQLALKADRRLRYLPPGPGSPVAQYHASPSASDMGDSPQTIQLELIEPIHDQLTLPISLLMTETSGIGNIRLPMLEPVGARSRRRWLAVSVDSGLEVTVQNDDALERVDAGEFAADWGKADVQPLVAYRLPAGDTPWSLATRPREPHTTVKQALAMSFARSSAQVRFDAELMTTAGYCFQYRLLIPQSLEVESVSLTADGAERVQRWAVDDEGMLNVFLSSRTTGAQRLSLRGRLPTPAAGKFSVPAIRIEGADPLPQGDVVQIFRQPTVLVTVEDRRSAADAAEPTWTRPPEQFGRPVVTLAAQAPDFSAELLLNPNQPLVDCVQVMFLEYEDQLWNAKVEHRLNIERGVIDVLRFDIPPDWVGPFETTPPAKVETTTDFVQGRRRLLVRPRTELEKGQHRMTIRAPLTVSDITQVMVPDIRPLQSGSEERFVVLPTQVGVEQVTWETTRLVPAELPEGFSAPIVSPEAFEVYRIVGEKPMAVLNAVQRSADMARVRLADYQLSWQPDGTARLAASFDLEPTGLAHCPLRLPRGWRLAQAAVAGIPVTPVEDADGWKLPLGANRLPQRVRVIALGPAGDGAHLWTSVRLPRPTLGDLPIEQTIWTLYPPPGWKCTEAAGTAAAADSVDCQHERLGSMATIVNNLSSDAAATTPTAELEQWRRTWARRLALLKIDVDRRLRQAGARPTVLREKLENLEQEWTDKVNNLDLAPLAEKLIEEQPLPDLTSELWEQSQAYGGSAAHFIARRGEPAPRVNLARYGQTGLIERLGGAAAVALATLLAMVALRSGIVVEFLRRWPYAAGVAAGIGWWLWLSPSVVGWLLVFISLAASFRRPWRSIPEPSSSIASIASLKG